VSPCLLPFRHAPTCRHDPKGRGVYALRVLIVEDNLDARGMLAFACEVEGHVVQQAADGKQALERLAHEARPDVILLDLAMPVMDGWEFRAAQKASEWADIPVMVVSAHENLKDIAAINPLACFRKPIDLDALIKALHTLGVD
jgi:CheY-like chemotaxis protein